MNSHELDALMVQHCSKINSKTTAIAFIDKYTDNMPSTMVVGLFNEYDSDVKEHLVPYLGKLHIFDKILILTQDPENIKYFDTYNFNHFEVSSIVLNTEVDPSLFKDNFENFEYSDITWFLSRNPEYVNMFPDVLSFMQDGYDAMPLMIFKDHEDDIYINNKFLTKSEAIEYVECFAKSANTAQVAINNINTCFAKVSH